MHRHHPLLFARYGLLAPSSPVALIRPCPEANFCHQVIPGDGRFCRMWFGKRSA